MKTALNIAGSLVILVGGLLWPVTWARGQQPQPSPPSTQTVKLLVIVTDKAGQPVDDLRQEEVQLVEDDPRAISFFSKDERHVDYGLAVDSSGSFRAMFKGVIQAAKDLVNNNQPEDEVFLERFISRNKIDVVEDFTAEKAKLRAGLDSLYVEDGQSAVIDAIYLAVKHTAEYRGSSAERRRAVVVFTDGEDRSSYYTTEQLLKLIRENDVQVFIVGFVTQLDNSSSLGLRPSPREKAKVLLNKIAEASGGRVFFLKKPQELADAVTKITHDLHFQYLLGFERQTKPGEKGFRSFKVKIPETPARGKLEVIARPSYSIGVKATGQQPGEKNSP